MAVVHNDVWTPRFIPDSVDAVETRAIDFLPIDGAAEVTMPEHTEPDERQSYVLGEEDFADRCRDFGEGVADAADHEVLEECCCLHEWRLLRFRCEIALADELIWQQDHCRNGQRCICYRRCRDERRNDNARMPHAAVLKNPTWIIS